MYSLAWSSLSYECTYQWPEEDEITAGSNREAVAAGLHQGSQLPVAAGLHQGSQLPVAAGLYQGSQLPVAAGLHQGSQVPVAAGLHQRIHLPTATPCRLSLWTLFILRRKEKKFTFQSRYKSRPCFKAVLLLLLLTFYTMKMSSKI